VQINSLIKCLLPIDINALSISGGEDIKNLVAKGDFRDDKYEINIGKKTIDFNCREEIFSITEPIGMKVLSNNCNYCDKNIAKTKPQYCDFCGARSCEKCMHKTRGFMSHLKNDLPTENDLLVRGSSTSFNKGIKHSRSMMTQNRPDSAGRLSVKDEPVMKGKVCKICDRKFFVWATFSKYQDAMDEQ